MVVIKFYRFYAEERRTLIALRFITDHNSHTVVDKLVFYDIILTSYKHIRCERQAM